MTTKLSLIAIALFTYGCSQLSPEARNIEVYYLKFRVPSECVKLGEVKAEAGSLMGADAASSTAEDNLKQQAYDMYKANTLFVDDSGEYFVGVNNQSYAEGTAYNCPK